MEVTCDVSDADFEAFLSGDADNLVDHVGDCLICQGRMEATLDDSTPHYVEQTMRAIRIHSFTRVTVETAVDLGSRYVRSALHYLLKG